MNRPDKECLCPLYGCQGLITILEFRGGEIVPFSCAKKLFYYSPFTNDYSRLLLQCGFEDVFGAGDEDKLHPAFGLFGNFHHIFLIAYGQDNRFNAGLFGCENFFF
jgi:hypothetical protein